MESKIRIAIEIVVAIALTYAVCRYFGLPIFTGGKDGIYGDGYFVFFLFFGAFRLGHLAYKGELRRKK